MKKILLSFLTIAVVAVVAVGATKAWFNDSETSADNTFTAGTLDLKTNNVDGTSHTFTINNFKPGDWTNGGQVNLKNTGSLPGLLWFEIVNVRDFENDCLEPEVNDVPLAYKDVSCGAGNGEGELSHYLRPSSAINVAPWGRFVGLTGGVTLSDAIGQRFDTRTADGNPVILNPGESLPLVIEGTWHPSYVTDHDNVVQSDSVEFDVVFHLEQIH